jgi:hypothetical protein
VEQPVEDGELGELLTLQHRAQVELDVGRAGEAGRVAQQAQPLAVGDDAPELLGAVEVLLDQGVGREARSARGGPRVEAGPDALDMHRRGVLVVAGAVRDGVGAALDQIGGAVAGQPVAQHAQQRDDPLLTGLGGGRLTRPKVLQVGLEERPLATRRLPRRADAVGEVARALQAEVLGALAAQLLTRDGVENVGGDEAALGCDGRVGHSYLYLCRLAELAQQLLGLGLLLAHAEAAEEVEGLIYV